MLGLFKRRKPAPVVAEALPLSVEAALAGLSVVCRPDVDQKARVLLQWACEGGTVAWHHTPEETRNRLAAAFPALTPGQLDLTLRAVCGMVRNAQQEGHIGPAIRRSAWASWNPNRKPIFE